MFIGHIGVGLALKRMAPTRNLAWLMLATMLLDVLLWCFVLFGLESVIIPGNYSDLRYLNFVFPYSHSLAGGLVWALLSYALLIATTKEKRFALAFGIAVMSHFVLDALVHPPQLTLFGNESPSIGLSLWNELPLELTLEVGLLGIGLFLYYQATAATTFTGRFGVSIFMAIITLAAIGGQLFGPAPETGLQVAYSSLGTLALLFFITFLLDRKRTVN